MQATRSSDRSRFVLAAASLLLPFVLASCGAGPTPPENELFREASLSLEDEAYTSAIQSYKKMLEEYPFSDKAEIASVNIAYAHYLNDEYPEAIAAFNDFERLYPVSPLLPFVSYTIGLCWLDQAKDGDRDATASDEALRQFHKVANEFPHTLYADLSNFRMQQASENLAAHELVVGDYYRQRKHYAAAASRYSYILSEFPHTENAGRAAARLKDIEVAAKTDAEKQAAKDAEKTIKAEVGKVDSKPAATAAAPVADSGGTASGASPASATPENKL